MEERPRKGRGGRGRRNSLSLTAANKRESGEGGKEYREPTKEGEAGGDVTVINQDVTGLSLLFSPSSSLASRHEQSRSMFMIASHPKSSNNHRLLVNSFSAGRVK